MRLELVTLPNIEEKLNSITTQIMDISISARGILADENDYAEMKVNNEYEPIFSGRLDRYSLESNYRFIKYGENLKEKPSSFEFFKGERILIRKIVSRKFRIIATLAKEKFVNKKDIYIFKNNSKDFSNKYLLGIINSKLLSFIKTKSSNAAKKDDFTQLTLNDIRNIRIPIPNKDIKGKFEDIIDMILNAKKEDSNSETALLEKEIDRMVYALYGLTEEEIRMVDV